VEEQTVEVSKFWLALSSTTPPRPGMELRRSTHLTNGDYHPHSFGRGSVRAKLTVFFFLPLGRCLRIGVLECVFRHGTWFLAQWLRCNQETTTTTALDSTNIGGLCLRLSQTELLLIAPAPSPFALAPLARMKIIALIGDFGLYTCTWRREGCGSRTSAFAQAVPTESDSRSELPLRAERTRRRRRRRRRRKAREKHVPSDEKVDDKQPHPDCILMWPVEKSKVSPRTPKTGICS
jgi:hypothetical protein